MSYLWMWASRPLRRECQALYNMPLLSSLFMSNTLTTLFLSLISMVWAHVGSRMLFAFYYSCTEPLTGTRAKWNACCLPGLNVSVREASRAPFHACCSCLFTWLRAVPPPSVRDSPAYSYPAPGIPCSACALQFISVLAGTQLCGPV